MSGVPLGLTGGIALGLYIGIILVVGYLARRARRTDSLSDFYLAGRALGPFVLFATLYATQYSGNSLLGYPGEAYRIGFAWVMSVGFMTAIIVAYLLVAPALYRTAKQLRFVTPGDWLDHRFGSPALTLVANVLIVVAVSNYLLAQLMAMGHVVAGLSGSAVPYWIGVLSLTLVILVYETIGGMRAVAWTDAVQGLLLLVGLGAVLAAIFPTPDHLRSVTEWVAAAQPEKAAVPGGPVCATWISSILLIGFSAAVYPQAIQRIYAARSVGALKRGISIMAFMPLVTMTPVFLIGIVGLQELSGLEGISADQVMPLLLRKWAESSLWLHGASILVVLAVVAAIMSTADSVLLSLSSIVAKDFLGRTVMKGASSARLTRGGKVASWLIVGVLVGIALVPRMTLWGLIELKMEVLVQVSPLFLLGLHWKRLTAPAALTGMVTGFLVSLALPWSGYARPFGFHDGLVGWLVNLLVCVAVSQLRIPGAS